MSVKYFGSDALNKLIDLVKTALGLKADNVSGATADDIATLTSGGNLKDSGISSLKVVDTGFVASAVIKNNINENAVDVMVSIEPNQDLHGYDYPWVGGSGKNLLGLSLSTIKSLNTSGTWSGNTYTLNGITFTFEATQDGYLTKFTANGTATQDTTIRLQQSNTTFPSGSLVSGISGGSWSTYGFEFVPNTYSNRTYLYNGSVALNDENVYLIEFVIRNGKNVSNLVAELMIRLASVADDTFEPYSNICPISGRSQTFLNFIGDQGGTAGTFQMGGVYYGGVYDVTTGVLTVDRVIVTFDGSNDENWTLSGNSKRVNNNDVSSDIAKPSATSVIANIISNRFKAVTANDTWNGVEGIAADTSGAISVHMGAEDTTMSVSDWRTWLSNNPLQVVYELAEPIIYNITAKTVMLPLGNSTGTASTGDIRVKYEKKFTDYYDDEIEGLDNEIEELDNEIITITPKYKDVYFKFSDKTWTQSSAGVYYATIDAGLLNNTVLGVTIVAWNYIKTSYNPLPFVASNNKIGVFLTDGSSANISTLSDVTLRVLYL